MTRCAVLLVVAFGLGCHSSGSTGGIAPIETIVGSGTITVDERPVAGFSSVTFATHGSLHVVQGTETRLSIRGDDNLLPYLVTGVDNGVLVIHTASNVDLQPTQTIVFELTVIGLAALRFNGVGGVRVSDLTSPNLLLEASGVGTLECSHLNVITLDARLSGLASMLLAGQVDEQSVRVDGFGDYDAVDLASREATVTLTSIGSAKVNVSERLVARISGSGSVYYRGDPRVESSVTGSGRVVRM